MRIRSVLAREGRASLGISSAHGALLPPVTRPISLSQRSSEEYEEFKKKRNPSSTWNYFLTSRDRKSAKCKICSKIVKTNGASTSGLHGHLKSKHDLKMESTQKRRKPEYTTNDDITESDDTAVLLVMNQEVDNDVSYEVVKDNEGKLPKKLKKADRMSSEEYEEFNKKRNPSSTWNYFLTSRDRKSAKCKICSQIVKTNGASTSRLHGHLKSKHDLKMESTQKRRKPEYTTNDDITESGDTAVLLVMNQEVDNDVSYEVVKDNEGRLPKKLKKADRIPHQFFEEYSKKRDPNSKWNYFLRSLDHQSAKCKICSRVLKTGGASTSSLHSHLRSRHGINILNKMVKGQTYGRMIVKQENTSEFPVSLIKQEVAETTHTVMDYREIDIDNFGECESSYQIENNVQNPTTPMKLISRMATLDGLPLSSFCSSADLRYLLSQSGYDLPTSEIETISLLLEQSDIAKAELTHELKQFKLSGLKFCLNFEEYTTFHNKKYVSVNIYNEDAKFGEPKNLGLLRIKNIMGNGEIIKLISDRLQSFDINLFEDVIAFTSGSPLAQLHFGISLEIDNQLCLAQAIQHGVLEVLYKEEISVINSDAVSSDESDGDNDINIKESKHSFCVKHPNVSSEPQLIYKDTVDKVRKLVLYYKNSATRNELLQNNVRNKHEKEIHLTLDCKKRWSSLCDMIGRFLKLKDCIHESLTYLEMDLFISDGELQILSEIHDSLVVIKATVTALCKPSANLLTADAALRFMLRKLDEQNNEFSQRFAMAIRNQIIERRTCLSSTLQYLHDRHTYNTYQDDDTFNKLSLDEIVSKILALLTRLKPLIKVQSHKNNIKLKTGVIKYHDPLESDDDEELSIEKQLENEIKTKCLNEIPKPTLDPQQLDLQKIIKGELSIYESTGGNRGMYLTMAYEILLSIRPATAEAEQFFYSKKDVNKRLSCHPEALLNAFFMLRSYFKQQRNFEE